MLFLFKMIPHVARKASLVLILGTNLIESSSSFVQDGSMRCDVNVSVRKRDQESFGTRVEIKNMNSFSAMQKAIEFEIDRQVSTRPGSQPKF